MSIYDRFDQHANRTFGEAAERYLREFTGKDRTRIEHAIAALLPYIGHLRLIDVDDEALAQFKHDRANGVGHFDQPAMVGTTNKELTQATTIINRACKYWRWLPSTPMFVHLEGPERHGYPLSWDEQDRLFEQLPTGWDVCAALFAINTGVRKSELFGLKWSDMREIPSLNTFVFILRETKNGEQRAVITNSIARRVVGHMRGQHPEFVFPSPLVRQAGKVYIEAWKRAGLPCDKLTKRGIHNLRHSCAFRLRQAEVPQEDRNAILGHARTNLAEHYALPDIERLTAAAERITIRRESVILRA
jgi:integrase